MRTHRSRRRSPVLLIIAMMGVLSLILAACGGGAADESAAEDAPADAAEEPEAGSLEEAAEFYRENTVTLAVGSSPGGGYDAYMRMLAPFLEEALGTTVMVENETGGGGLLMINNAVTDPEQDGTELMIINGIGAAGSALSGAEGVAFELDELSYIGMVSAEVPALAVRADSELETLDDLTAAEDLLFGATGVSSSANTNAVALIAALGLDATVATNFEGSSELELALLAGDIDTFTGSLDSRIPSVEAGETRALLIVDDEPAEELPDVPTVADLEPYYAEGGEEIMQAHLAVTRFHRPLATHPGIPPERLEYLRQVFAEVMQDPELIAQAEEIERPLFYLSGEEVEEIVADVVSAPEAYAEVLEATVE